ncbi:MAG: type II secretion system GspH family protein [Akkermansiaceae bacterium]|nr:type II secretion system GspH family protein [Akkermansiaceae bacterium]
MKHPKSAPPRIGAAGFTLPAILVVVGALLILAVGILIVAGIERSTARSFVDRQRAELAARTALEDIRSVFTTQAVKDDFLVIQSNLKENVRPTEAGGTPREKAPFLFLTRAEPSNSGLNYTHIPLFSSSNPTVKAANSVSLLPPPVEDFLSSTENGRKDFEALPYQDFVRADWMPVRDDKNRTVARYAYWIEDLQSRVDAQTAGNTKDSGKHKRFGWKSGETGDMARFPAPGLNPEPSKIGADGRDENPPLDQVALYLLDPDSTAKDDTQLDNSLVDGRSALISPNSALAVASIVPRIVRGDDGRLVDPKARAVEESLSTQLMPYDEQALVPAVTGVDPSVVGEPKLNLNALIKKPANQAVDEMAAWIKKGLPEFETRKGGFPDDYVKTIAANAIDYADTNSEGSVSSGGIMGGNSYRGIDAYPLMSEVVLHIKYNGVTTVRGRKRLNWEFILFAELWNHSNIPVTGTARLSYENGMLTPAIGAEVGGVRFDDPVLMGDVTQVQPALANIAGRYWSPPFSVNLQPNQYKFYRAATVIYTMDVGPSSQTLQNTFEIYENLGSSGISMMWNNVEVDRNDKLVRGNTAANELEYITNFRKQSGKANIPGHSYGTYNTSNNYKNNMGDSRQALYLRGADYPLSDNSYPGNISPNRRNIRNVTIYRNGSGQQNVYGRVLPSEWPDSGHDTPVSGIPTSSPPVNDYDPTNTIVFPDALNAREGDAPTFVSNRGRFFSATELGRVFDPVMYTPKFDNASDTASLLTGRMPSGRVSWPVIETGSNPDIYYGGGNTLRIGRPEHPEFAQPTNHKPAEMPETHAARLLDLFHAGKSRSTIEAEREGGLVRIEGHININTATKDALRAVAGGMLVKDPVLFRRTSDSHVSSTMAPPVVPLEASTPTRTKEADVIADAIIRGRPYGSPSEIASVVDENNRLVFGNRELLPDGNKVQWSDAAAEEAFARVFNSSTVRSRNFRIWVVGQSISPLAAGSTATPEVLAEVRKAFNVFVDPGARKTDGTIDPTKVRITVPHENDF